MITRFADLPIARKQALAFAMLTAMFGGFGYVTYSKLDVIKRSNDAVVRSYQVLDQVRIMSSAVTAQQRSLGEYVETGRPQALERHRSDRADFEGAASSLRSTAVTPGQIKRAADLGYLGGVWQREVADREIAAMAGPDGRDQARAIASDDAFFKGFTDKVAEIDVSVHALRTQSQAAADEAFSAMRMLLIAGGAAVLLVSLGAGWLLKRSVSAPIQRMTCLMHRLATGDTAVAIPPARRDEVGRMAQAVQVFRDGALERLRLEAEAASMREAAETERMQREGERAAAAAAQGAVVSALATGLERLAAGDLASRLHQDFGPEYAALRANFNDALDTVQAAMQAIVGSANSVRAGSGEISQAADDLSRRTEKQAASLEETAAALDEITTAVRQTAEGAKGAHDVVAQTREDAERSGQVVRDAVTAMGGIEESSKKIGNIIGVIDEIAFQTNLLALNAGVEAARAGDAGRGFAVVASEVRALAQRSAEAAREIKALIAASAGQVDTGVRLVGQTGQSLARIVEQVARISTVVADIANSAQQQATGLQEVNTAVNQMDQVTQQNAAMVEESTAASRTLSQEAEQLSQLTARFDLGPGGDALPPGRRADNAPPARTVTALRTVAAPGRGGAARKPQAALEPAGWEEF